MQHKLRAKMRWCLIFILCSSPLIAAPEKERTTGVEVSLISENLGVVAGGTFRLGLRIQHQSGYHTYWRNPGVAGVATGLVWKLPAGFAVGEIQWPYPEKTTMASHPVFGYEREVMLLVEITAPPVVSEPHVTLHVDATWMACATGCYPGRKNLEIMLPRVEKATADPVTAAAFLRATTELPGPLVGWDAELLTAKDAAISKILVRPKNPPSVPLREAYFFSADGQISSEQPQPLLFHPDGSFEITVTRGEYGPTGKGSLPGVLKLTDSQPSQVSTFAQIDPSYLTPP